MGILSVVPLAPCRAVSLLFCAWTCWEAHQHPAAPVRCTQSEHEWSITTQHQGNQHPLLEPYIQNTSANLLFSLFCRGVYTGETLVPAAARGYADIPTFGQDFSEHQAATMPHSRWNELPSIHHSYCLLSWDVSALRKYTFIFILLLKDIHLLGWWIFRAFFTVLIAHHHFKSTWNGWVELLRWEKVHFTLFLLWYYQT